MKVVWSRLLGATFLVLSAQSMGLAQSGATGTITGVVTDSAGALVPDAEVTITNTATNLSQATQTSTAGSYAVPFLKPGSYQISVSSPGFSRQVLSGVIVEVGKEIAADIQLWPGEVSESVSVSASPVALDTANAAVGHVVTERQILELPL